MPKTPYNPFCYYSERILTTAYELAYVLLTYCLRLLTFAYVFWLMYFFFLDSYQLTKRMNMLIHDVTKGDTQGFSLRTPAYPCVSLRILTYPVTTANELLTTANVFWSRSHTRTLTNSM